MKKICFIVGHGKSKSGGYDPGACAGGFQEYRIAKEIAGYAQTYYNSTYTERADIMNADADLYLTERIDRVNAGGYDFVVEVHLNAGGGTGTECYYHIGGTEGRKYAEAISAGISAAFGVTNRGAKTKANAAGKDYFAIIRETRPTAVLVECGFIDTASDRSKLSTADGQARCGEAIARAIAEVRGAKCKAPEQAAKAKLYRVQVGAYSKRENAERQLAAVRKAGFNDAIIVTEQIAK